MIGTIAKVVETTFGVSEETAGGGPHAVAIGTFDDMRCGGEGGSAHGVVLGTGPESKNNEIGFLGLPPLHISNLGRGGP